MIHEFYVHDDFPMYVQRWGNPKSDTGRAAVLVHGGAHSGVCWSSTPDGRPGWAPLMAERGWTVLVVDWPGIGRSPRDERFLTTGAGPIIQAIAELLRSTGPALVVGHSMGAAFSFNVMEHVPDLVTGLMAVTPAPLAAMGVLKPNAPLDRPVRYGEAAALRQFANSERFPHAAFKAYLRSLCDISPAVVNALASQNDGLSVKPIDRRLLSIPSVVIAGDQDQVIPPHLSAAVAQYLQCDHIMVGRDWGFNGFGHMIPIEVGSEQILFKALDHLGSSHL